MVPAAQWGFASSPVIHRDRIVLQVDVQKDSFLGAFVAEGRPGALADAAAGRADVEHAGRSMKPAAARR